MKKDELTREMLVGVANELNKVLGLKPLIVVDFESSLKGAALKAVEKKFMEQLQKDVAESGALLAPTDVLEPKTIDILEALEVKDIRTKLASGGTAPAPAPATEKSDTKEEKAVKTKKASAKGKKAAAPKKAKTETPKKVVEKDQYGFRKGSKSSEAVKLLVAGKITMKDVKKKFGLFKLTARLEARGWKVKENSEGKYSITGKMKD